MKQATCREVIARIDGVANGVGVAAFDGDGTLWSGDVGDDYFFALVERDDVRPAARACLDRDARAYGLSTEGTGAAVAKRLFEAYQRGVYPERSICEMMGRMTAEWTRAEVSAFAERVIDGGGFASRVHAEAIEIAEALRARGHRTVLVSASPRPVVEAAGRRLGFAELVATTPLVDGDVLLAAVQEPIPYDEGKVSNLRALVGDAPLVAAFGDNAFDVPMLRAANVAVAVRPKDRLVARAAEVSGLLRVDASSVTRA